MQPLIWLTLNGLGDQKYSLSCTPCFLPSDPLLLLLLFLLVFFLLIFLFLPPFPSFWHNNEWCLPTPETHAPLHAQYGKVSVLQNCCTTAPDDLGTALSTKWVSGPFITLLNVFCHLCEKCSPLSDILYHNGNLSSVRDKATLCRGCLIVLLLIGSFVTAQGDPIKAKARYACSRASRKHMAPWCGRGLYLFSFYLFTHPPCFPCLLSNGDQFAQHTMSFESWSCKSNSYSSLYTFIMSYDSAILTSETWESLMFDGEKLQ